jgi:UDP-N-acetylmuramoylalanine--D-glutamate ligase
MNGSGKTAGVVGAGRSGAAAARMLAHCGYTVAGFDSRESASVTEHMSRAVFGDFSSDDLFGLSLLVLSPGVPVTAPIVRQAEKLSIPVIGEVELALRNTSSAVLAVTGSNGKTTTVLWLSHTVNLSAADAKAVAAGNMGYAFCDAVLDNPQCPVFVLELSSYQLETIYSLKASSAAVLNLTPDHLARHGTMQNYGRAKARVFQNQGADDTAVLNYDDPLLDSYRNISNARQMFFSLEQEVPLGAWLDSSGMLFYRDESGTREVVHSRELALRGRHNTANALAVICMGASYGIPVEDIVPGLSDFSGVPHRIEPLGEAAGLVWFNDSKSTNVDSLKVALESFEEKVILIAGGQKKNSDYSVLNELIERRAKAVVVFGSGAGSLAGQWHGTVPVSIVDSLDQAVEEVLSRAEKSDTVLLSPGCASFDQYADFEERGEHFRRIVQALK